MAQRIFSWLGFTTIMVVTFLVTTNNSYAAATTTTTTTTVTVGSSVGIYQVLTAKVAHLEALLAALREGETVAAPTFVMAVHDNVVRVDGTLMRSKGKLLEICGPMAKGSIDWGDGTSQTIHGLGCSGDTHTFTQFHVYTTAGSYRITLNGETPITKVVAVGKADLAASRPFSIAQQKMSVTLQGGVTLDTPLTPRCVGVAVAVVDWGDGSTDQVMNDCGKSTFTRTHEYQTAGTYIVLVRDREGDAAQKLLTVK